MGIFDKIRFPKDYCPFGHDDPAMAGCAHERCKMWSKEHSDCLIRLFLLTWVEAKLNERE